MLWTDELRVDDLRVDGVCYEDGKLDSIYVKTPEGHKRFVLADVVEELKADLRSACECEDALTWVMCREMLKQKWTWEV